MAWPRANCASSRRSRPVLALAGELHLQLGIATGGEPSPWPDAAQRAVDQAKVAAGLAHCAAHGHHLDGEHGRQPLHLRAAGEMEAEGRLTARVKVPFHFKPHMELSELDRAERDGGGVRRRLGDERASSRCSWTGWWTAAPPICWTTIPGTADTRSAPLFEPERFKEICRRDRPAGLADRRPCHRRRGGARDDRRLRGGAAATGRATAATGSSISS